VKQITKNTVDVIFESIFNFSKNSDLDFKKDYFISGKNYYKVCNLYNFPFEVNNFWLANLFSLKGVF
jgi:hypothetical protein